MSLTTSALFGATMTKDSIYDYEMKVCFCSAKRTMVQEIE